MKIVNLSVLICQVLVLSLCAIALWLFAANFPFPSPLVKDFLPPKKRWPTAQVQQWVRNDTVPKGFLDFFSRDPERAIPSGQNVVAPSDGVVRNIIRKENWTYIDIALSFWDVHVQRSPVAGQVTAIRESGDQFMDGEYKNMVFLRDKHAPVQKVIDLSSAWGDVKMRLVTSLMARRIRVLVPVGEQVDKGQRIGRILLGSTVILQLPPDMPLAIQEGERVIAGETIISGKQVVP